MILDRRQTQYHWEVSKDELIVEADVDADQGGFSHQCHDI
jgi:hypothetical protein